MYKLSQALQTRKITPKEAEAFLAMNNFRGQRELQEVKARRYSELLLRGELRPVDIAIATCPDGNRYLMNGQHVCQGCVWADKEMSSVIAYYKCDEWEDAWKLFATFDVHASRTQNQIFKAARGLFANESLRDVPIRVLSSCATALVCLNAGRVDFHRGTQTADKTTKPLIVQERAEEVLWVATFSENSTLMRVGPVAAMIATRRKHPKEAEEFWRKIHSGLGFKSKTEPQKRIHDFLNRSRFHANGRSSAEIAYATCIAWWNSFITGNPRQSVKLGSMQEMPKVQ